MWKDSYILIINIFCRIIQYNWKFRKKLSYLDKRDLRILKKFEIINFEKNLIEENILYSKIYGERKLILPEWYIYLKRQNLIIYHKLERLAWLGFYIKQSNRRNKKNAIKKLFSKILFGIRRLRVIRWYAKSVILNFKFEDEEREEMVFYQEPYFIKNEIKFVDKFYVNNNSSFILFVKYINFKSIQLKPIQKLHDTKKKHLILNFLATIYQESKTISIKKKFYRYLLLYFKHIFNVHILNKNLFFFLHFIKTKKLVKSTVYPNIFKRYGYLFEKGFFSYRHIFEVFYNVCKYKNIDYLVEWFTTLFKHVNFFKHQFLLNYIRFFLKYLGDQLYSNFNINGVFIKCRGKIARAGNSRRKRFNMQHNHINTCHQYTYLIEKFQLESFTGVVGVTIIISFNA